LPRQTTRINGRFREHRNTTTLDALKIVGHRTDTASAVREHRAHKAFIEDSGPPEVQPCWRRSRYLPLKVTGFCSGQAMRFMHMAS
jgi:hypothetical protein